MPVIHLHCRPVQAHMCSANFWWLSFIYSRHFSSGSVISASGTDLIDSVPVPIPSQPVQHPPSQSASVPTSDAAPTTPAKPKAPVDPSKFTQKWKPSKIAIPSSGTCSFSFRLLIAMLLFSIRLSVLEVLPFGD